MLTFVNKTEDERLSPTDYALILAEKQKRIEELEAEKIVDFCNEVDRKAQELMLTDGKVSGKHYAAMRIILKERYGIEWGK